MKDIEKDKFIAHMSALCKTKDDCFDMIISMIEDRAAFLFDYQSVFSRDESNELNFIEEIIELAKLGKDKN